MGSHVRRVPSDLVQPLESKPRLDAERELVRRACGLGDARRMRDAIVIVLALLGKLDELMPDDRDGSVFMEIADLFDDVSGFAAVGAQAARKAAGGGR